MKILRHLRSRGAPIPTVNRQEELADAKSNPPRHRGMAVYSRRGDMGDVGTQLHSGEIGCIFGADALMITAGSCTGLPAQESWRLTEEVFPKVIIPMHYRDGNRGARLEHIDAFTDYFEAPEMIHHYQTNSNYRPRFRAAGRSAEIHGLSRAAAFDKIISEISALFHSFGYLLNRFFMLR